jgi:hypothetical protein
VSAQPGGDRQVVLSVYPFARPHGRWDARDMSSGTVEPPYLAQFLATAEAAAQARPDEVDLELAREVFLEVATLLHNSLALDSLDEHDADAVVDALCDDLVASDPGAAIRARSLATLESPGDVHEPQVVSETYLLVAALFQL